MDRVGIVLPDLDGAGAQAVMHDREVGPQDGRWICVRVPCGVPEPGFAVAQVRAQFWFPRETDRDRRPVPEMGQASDYKYDKQSWAGVEDYNNRTEVNKQDACSIKV